MVRCLPPGVDDRAGLVADVLVVPLPGPRVDRLADGAEQAETGEIAAGRPVLAPLHERPDRRRRRVEDVDRVLLDDLPETILLGVIGRPLVHHRRRPQRERAVDDVRMARDPPDVGRTPVRVLRLDVQHRLGRPGDVGEVPASGVFRSLGLTGSARGVHQEQHVLGVPGHRLDPIALVAGHQLVVIVLVVVELVGELLAQPVDDDHVFDLVLDAGEPLVGLLQMVERVAATIIAVAGDEIFGVRRVHARRERVRREPREHDRVGRADPGAGQHRDRQLRDHRHVHRHDVVLLDAELAQRGGELVDLSVEILIRVRARLAELAFPLDGGLVFPAVLDVPVDAVVRRVQLAVHEPLVERCILVVQYLVPLALPVEELGRSLPRLRPFVLELLVDRVVRDVRLLDERLGRLEGVLFYQSRFELYVRIATVSHDTS